MTEIQMFQGYEVRFVGTAEVPEWAATDVVAILYPDSLKTSRAKLWKNIPPRVLTLVIPLEECNLW